MPVVLSAPSTPQLSGASLQSPRLQPMFHTVIKPISRLPKRARESSPPLHSSHLSTPATSGPLTPLAVIDASPPASPTLRRLVHLRLTDSKSSPSASKAQEDVVLDLSATGSQNRLASPAQSGAGRGEKAISSPTPSLDVPRSRSCTPDSNTGSPQVKRRRRDSDSAVLTEDESEDESSDHRMNLPLPPQFRIKPSPLHSSFSATLSPPHQPRQLRSKRDYDMTGQRTMTVSQATGTTTLPTRALQASPQTASPQASPVLVKVRARLQHLNPELQSGEAARTEIDKVFALGYGRGLGASIGGGGVTTRRQSALRQSQVDAQEQHEADIPLPRDRRRRVAQTMDIDG